MITSPEDLQQARALITELLAQPPKSRSDWLSKLIRKYTKADGHTFSKSELLSVSQGYTELFPLLKKKPVRTLSGVTPVTVLTKPYPCPGSCIFCPSDVRMPKSYIATEPGAQRAGQYGFHPYAQMYNRLQAYREIGHPVSKIEVIVLGGTWSAYPQSYQVWFITELFRALNDFGDGCDHRPVTHTIVATESLPEGQTYNQYIGQKNQSMAAESATWEELSQEQQRNERNNCRCVGLVLETRPDRVNQEEVIRLRRFGATKIQIGIQSMSNSVLALNKRGHTVEETLAAVNLLRQAGFKIHGHWMPNLYGSTIPEDRNDYPRLFKDICPDELKIYPCSLIAHTELMTIYSQQLWQPYTTDELSTLLQYVMVHTPEYCRLTRIIRDIPGTEIVAGNKSTNLRQLVETKEVLAGDHDIRAREIKGQAFDVGDLMIDDVVYQTPVSTEHFLQYITKDRKIAGFLRLSLPTVTSIISELNHTAIIREIHVYGQSVTVGKNKNSAVQHQGLGKNLIKQAATIAFSQGLTQLSVISAVGTREYYRKNGFVDGELYQHLKLQP